MLELPTLYADHHVIEVRRLLFELPGVQDVYASSAFQVVEVTYDPDKVTEADLNAKLEASGYLGGMQMSVETGEASYANNGKQSPFMRHTAVYETTRQVISFSQVVDHTGRPLWPCPGFGVIKTVEE
jgi:copper chaperone CopZ